jgi:putative protein kinase ArgK-like GTPase of G3E family
MISMPAAAPRSPASSASWKTSATGFHDLLNALHERLGRAHRIGITGPPGAGKSTLTAALIAHYRGRGERSP